MVIRVSAFACFFLSITLPVAMFAQDPPLPDIPLPGDTAPAGPPAVPTDPVTAPAAPISPPAPPAAPVAPPVVASPQAAPKPLASTAATNPQKIPFLRPHFVVPESKETVKKLLGYFEELPRLAEQAASGKGSGKQMATGRARGNQIARELERLRLFGEPLVVDMRLRAGFYGGPINEALEAYLMTPKGLKDREKAKIYVARTAPARGKIIQKLIELVNKGDYVQAEILLDKTYDDLYPVMAYIHHYDHKVVYDPFAEVHSVITGAMTTKRLQATKIAFQAVITDALARRDALLAILEQGRTEMPQGGNVTIDGQSLPGPVAATAVFAKWDQTHTAFLRAQAVDIAGQVSGAGSSVGFTSNLSFWGNESGQLAAAIQKAIVDWIAIDAQMAPAALAKQRYVAYLQAIAGVSHRMTNGQWQSGFESALASLATRAELAGAIATYEKSTSELLLWRSRVTTAMVQKESAAFPDLPATSEAALPYEKSSLGFHLTTTTFQRPSIPCLFVAMPQSVPWALSIMQNRPVSVTESFYRLGEQKIWMSRYRQGVYARLATTPEPINEIGRLKNELLVDPDHLPLTMKAAAAIASAERGEFRRVGGLVVNLGLEGSLSRFAVIPPEESSLVEFDQIQLRVDAGDELSGLSIRYDIQPQWLAHDYFFHRIGASP